MNTRGKSASLFFPIDNYRESNTEECTHKGRHGHIICDGSKMDCERKGKVYCDADPKCYGITFRGFWLHQASFMVISNSVAICTSDKTFRSPGSPWISLLKWKMDGEWSAWGGFGKCSKTCGNGLQYR